MTEDYKLSVFFHLEQYTGLKLMFVCEEGSENLKSEFEECSDLIFREFDKKKIS